MNSAGSETDGNQFFESSVGSFALGAAYIVVGLGLFYALATNSIELLTAVLVGTLGLILLSVAILGRREGLLTAENKLIGAFVLVAMALLFGLYGFTELSNEVVFGTVFVVGVIIPHLLLEYTDYGTSE